MRISLLDNIKNGYVIQDLLSFSPCRAGMGLLLQRQGPWVAKVQAKQFPHQKSQFHSTRSKKKQMAGAAGEPLLWKVHGGASLEISPPSPTFSKTNSSLGSLSGSTRLLSAHGYCAEHSPDDFPQMSCKENYKKCNKEERNHLLGNSMKTLTWAFVPAPVLFIASQGETSLRKEEEPPHSCFHFPHPFVPCY